MTGNGYYYQRDHLKGCNNKGCVKDCKFTTLPDAVCREVVNFRKKFGYNPEFVVVRLDEYVKGKYSVPVKKVTRNCQPSHFQLYPVVNRTSRTFTGERVACKK